MIDFTDKGRAHFYATRSEKRNTPSAWDKDEDGFCGQYWWGLFEGYKAGLKRGRKQQRDKAKA